MAKTGQGDTGYTDLLTGERVPKDDPRIEALGTLDEATSALGLARASTEQQRTREVIYAAQRQLYRLMAELAMPPDHPQTPHVTAQDMQELDEALRALQAEVEIPSRFTIPGACRSAAAVDLARAIVRRAERALVVLSRRGLLPNPQLLAYLNRLSLLLYVLARYEDVQAGVAFELAPRPRERGQETG